MKLRVERFASNGDATLSLVFLDDEYQCFGLEDEAREVKVAGETRIPAGEYRVALRITSPMSNRYAQRFPGLHGGMLWLQDVPGFKWVYIHIGNYEDQTAGCILVGQSAYTRPEMEVGRSTAAYEALYRKVIGAAQTGDLSIEVVDRDL